MTHAANYTTARQAWTMVAVLTLCNVLSQIDRFAMTLLITPMQRDLGLNDTEIGVVGGLVTGLFYALAGLPLARLADQYSRKWLIVIGLIGWSLMTGLSGLAIGFWTLCAARMLLAVGDASLGPAANSMIADVFPVNRLSKPLSVYAAAASLGNALASVLVAMFMAASVWVTPHLSFAGAPLAPWRVVMIGLALVGLMPTLLMAGVVREPDRPHDAAHNPGFGRFLTYLRPRLRAYAPCYLGYAFFVLPFVALQFWLPTSFERLHGLAPTTSGVWLGIGYLAAGLPGTLAGGWLADALDRRGGNGGKLIVLMLATLVATPAAALSQIAGNPIVGMGGVWVAMFAAAMALGPVTAGIQALTVVEFRAQAAAVLYILIFIVAFMGIPIAGALTDQVFEDPMRIGHALIVLGVVFGALSLFIVWRGMPHFRAALPRDDG